MSKVYGLVMIRNEADRYLQSSLCALAANVDSLFVYDDRSTDTSVEVAKEFADLVVQRDLDLPSFLENEGRFRNSGWGTFVHHMNPTCDDWIVCLDADEFLISPFPFKDVIKSTNNDRGLKTSIPEAWEINGDLVQVRIDGFWNSNSAVRIFPFKDELKFRNRTMGVGASPIVDDYIEERTFDILHCGYANEKDRFVKYDRYKTNTKGHNPKHINSILSPATLAIYSANVPEIWRGLR